MIGVVCFQFFSTPKFTYQQYKNITRGPKGHISCTWVHCATFLRNWLGRQFLLTDRPEKYVELVEDVEILLPVKTRWILFGGFRGEVENVSTNQRPGRPSCFSDRHEKHKLGRGHWDLASYQVSWNSMQQIQRRSQKYLGQSETREAILFFGSARKHKLCRGCWDLCFWSCFVEFRSAVLEEKMSQPIRGQGGNLVFPIGPKKKTW